MIGFTGVGQGCSGIGVYGPPGPFLRPHGDLGNRKNVFLVPLGSGGRGPGFYFRPSLTCPCRPAREDRQLWTAVDLRVDPYFGDRGQEMSQLWTNCFALLGQSSFRMG